MPAVKVRKKFYVTRDYDVPRETMESRIIRDNLCDIATRDDVRKAVSAIDGQYVLQLDQGEPYVASPHLFTYGEGEQWRGIDSIRDNTPGFEVVLAEDDMRLYKITAVEG